MYLRLSGQEESRIPLLFSSILALMGRFVLQAARRDAPSCRRTYMIRTLSVYDTCAYVRTSKRAQHTYRNPFLCVHAQCKHAYLQSIHNSNIRMNTHTITEDISHIFECSLCAAAGACGDDSGDEHRTQDSRELQSAVHGREGC
jgi:hypothetical protein